MDVQLLGEGVDDVNGLFGFLLLGVRASCERQAACLSTKPCCKFGLHCCAWCKLSRSTAAPLFAWQAHQTPAHTARHAHLAQAGNLFRQAAGIVRAHWSLLHTALGQHQQPGPQAAFATELRRLVKVLVAVCVGYRGVFQLLTGPTRISSRFSSGCGAARPQTWANNQTCLKNNKHRVDASVWPHHRSALWGVFAAPAGLLIHADESWY